MDQALDLLWAFANFLSLINGSAHAVNGFSSVHTTLSGAFSLQFSEFVSYSQINVISE